MENNNDIIKALQEQLEEAKSKTAIITKDLENAIENVRNSIGKEKEDPIAKIIREQKENGKK